MTPTFAVRFDMRRAPFSAVAESEQYSQALAMARWAGQREVGVITVSEHHGVDFISAPLTLAGAILGATDRARVMVNALLVTLHDPVRLAEQLATLDLVSGGRISIVAGLGYRPEEFEMAGLDRSERGRLIDENLRIICQAWTGEPFEWRGRTVKVTPTPVSPAEHVLFVGGSVRRSAERAARLRLSFFPMSMDSALEEAYRTECAKLGFDSGIYLAPNGPSFVHVTEDPERARAEIARFALYDAQSYAGWQTGDHHNPIAVEGVTLADLEATGMWRVVTPEECIQLARQFGSVTLHPLMGGIPPELGWNSLELFVDKVQSAL
jgi:alkanesulfonate monooxygenase SsuD/methylene tetrahydromethanopterin reductase-like flavin-dependent oxidoreductase (luciferase family)